ncbi:MAG: alanine racemase C-terminal domain-containing protein, partial [Woeseiales bacterium]
GDISIANSGGLFGAARSLQRFSNASREGRVWMRPGIALFGVSPIEGSLGTELGLKPAMNFESTLIAIKAIRAGQPVGYGGEWQAPCDTKIGVIAVGYGDGYACYMQAGAPMSINDREVRAVGAVSMDLTTVDHREAAVFDE